MFLSQTSQMYHIRAAWVRRCFSAEDMFFETRVILDAPKNYEPNFIWCWHRFTFSVYLVSFLLRTVITQFSIFIQSQHFCHLLQHSFKKNALEVKTLVHHLCVTLQLVKNE